MAESKVDFRAELWCVRRIWLDLFLNSLGGGISTSVGVAEWNQFVNGATWELEQVVEDELKSST